MRGGRDIIHTVALHLLHTNDFHSHLTGAGAARLQAAWEALGAVPKLLLDAGDAIKAGNVGVNPFGEPVLGTMSDLGYAAMALGNREFHVLSAALCAKIGRARFPVLCANLRPKREGAPVPVQPSLEIETGGVRVGVFGLTVPMVTERMAARALSDFLFDDPVATAARMVRTLRPRADLVVLLSHLGLREDERVASRVEGIDLIVGGHSHVVLEQPKIVSGVPILQAGMHARWFGHATLEPGSTPLVAGYALLPLEEKRP